MAQSTLSRDLKELRVFRVPVAEGYRYLPAGEEPAAPGTPPALSGVAAGDRRGDRLKRAFRDPSYSLIFIGFFSCGYQLSFVTAHFPAFVTEVCGPIAPGSLLHGMGITTTSALTSGS